MTNIVCQFPRLLQSAASDMSDTLSLSYGRFGGTCCIHLQGVTSKRGNLTAPAFWFT